MSEEKKEEGPNRIMVFLRIRPQKKGEISEETGGLLMDILPDEKTVVVKEGGGKSYNFDGVYDGPNVDQGKVFRDIAIPVIDNVFKGYWGTMMVYGQTGTGKSFTMCNFSPTLPGIIPRTMTEMFRKIDADTERIYTVLFSFIQIYLDRLQDLFNPEAPELKITREDKEGVQFPGITEREIKTEQHFREQYEDGNQYRVITATKMNPESSRGHAALFIQIKSKPKDEGSGGEIRNGKLMLIDLAGYERFSKTGVQEGIMKEEAKTINASLLALGNCVQGLAEKSSHVPWRNAKLTRMIQDAIGGRAKCSIILTAGPSAEHYHETTGTLYFGSRAMSVKTDAKLTLNVDYQKLAKKLQEMLSQAEDKINLMEVQATQRQLEREQAMERMLRDQAGMKKRHEDQLQQLLADGASPDKIRALLEGNKVEVEMLEEQHFIEKQSMEEENEKEIKSLTLEVNTKSNQQSTQQIQELDKEVVNLRRRVKELEEENGQLKSKTKDAETENRRVAISNIELKMNSEQAVLDNSIKAVVASGGNISASALDSLKKDYERQLKNVKEMLEESHTLKIQALEEELREDAEKFKKLYDESVARYNRDITTVKDQVIAKYESEMESVKRTSQEVQEKLKKNHMTIKKAYQSQKEELQRENEGLLKEIGDLQEKLERMENTATTPASPTHAPTQPASPVGAQAPEANRAKGPSRAELLIQRKQEEKKVKVLEERVEELINEIEYIKSEKFQVEQMYEKLKPKPEDDLMQSSATKQRQAEKDAYEQQIAKLDKEILKLKASLALSGPTAVADDKEEEEEVDTHIADDIGDFEGLKTFHDKIMKNPFMPQGGNMLNTYDQVVNTLTPDLADYRLLLRYRLFMMGKSNTGKSSIVKCLITPPPLIKNVPDVVTPTLQPLSILTNSIDDRQGQTDLYTVYIKNQDIVPQVEVSAASPKGVLNMMASVVGLGGSGDPAKVMWEVLDHPGNDVYWEGMPPYLLPIKNAVYAITYRISQPMDVIKEEITKYMSLIHASVHMKRSKGLGQSGEAIRVGVVLLGTHRDLMRDAKEAAVVNATLSRITSWVGELLYQLKYEDSHHGITVIGNFALSCKDWTVQCTKRSLTFKELLQFISAASTTLYPIRPSVFVPQSGSSTTSVMSFLMGDDALEGDVLSKVEKVASMNDKVKRLRKGIITVLTAIQRDRKMRWLYDEPAFRSLIASHLNLPQGDSRTTLYENFLIRELVHRGLIVVMPFQYAHESTMPPATPIELHEISMEEAPSPEDRRDRQTVICLDPMHLINITAAFLLPALLGGGVPKEDKTSTQLYEQLKARQNTSWMDGLITAESGALTMARFTRELCGQDIKVVFELACVMGLALQAKQEGGVLSPALFTRDISPLLMDYLPYLLCTYGDGVGRKYTMNAPAGFFFHRLQVKLMPFSHAPTPTAVKFNWHSASYLYLQKDRFKWGVIGSSALKAAIVAANAPIRGFMRLEGNQLYVVVVTRAGNPAAMDTAAKAIMDAIHKEITLLCRREFRGVRATYQEMALSGVDNKRKDIQTGVKTILSNHKVPADAISQQLALVADMGKDPKGGEIDNALQALFTTVPTA